jgi:hypothetical protein
MEDNLDVVQRNISELCCIGIRMLDTGNFVVAVFVSPAPNYILSVKLSVTKVV